MVDEDSQIINVSYSINELYRELKRLQIGPVLASLRAQESEIRQDLYISVLIILPCELSILPLCIVDWTLLQLKYFAFPRKTWLSTRRLLLHKTSV